MYFFTLQNYNKKFQGGLILTIMLLMAVQIVNAQSHRLIITEPTGIAGEYEMLAGGFGAASCSINNITAEANFVVDGTGGTLACDTVTNDLTGKIAFLDRGDCNFSLKAYHAQEQGAVAVVVCNNVADAIFSMGGGDFGDLVTIPTLMMSLQDCNIIRPELEGATVTIVRNDFIDMSGETVIWEDQFDGGFGDWTVNNISCGGTPTDTFQLWRWSAFGNTTGSSCGDNNIISPSSCNGAAVFASDAYDNLPGADCGTGGGPCSAIQIGELISPPIDLSNSTAAGVSLRFYQSVRQYQSTFFVGYSIDGGVTWDSTEINQEIAVNESNVGTPVIKIPLVGAVGQPDVRVKFRYEANYYYWIIDDVQIVEQEANNLRVNENFYATPANAMTPLSQVEPLLFLADVENVGAVDQNNVILNMSITDQDNNEVFSADNDYGTVPANTAVENVLFLDTYTPTAEGLFNGTYSISADAEDDDPTNNTQAFEFMVSDTTFAKEFGATRTILPAASNYDDGAPFSYAYGNHFYIANGTDANGNPYVSRSMSFALQGTPESAGKELVIILYKWEDTDPDAITPQAEPEERELINYAIYLIQGDEVETDIITLPFEDGPTVLEEGAHYLLMVEYSATEQISVVLGASDVIDYSAAIFTSNLAGTPRFGSFLGVPSDGDLFGVDYNSVGFGRDLVPVVRLNVTPSVLDGINVQVLKNEFKLFPNPASDQISIQMNLKELAKTATVRIYDIAGRQIMQETYDNIQKERLTYNLNNFAAGTYKVQVVTDKGMGTKLFVVK
ncbi:MAG: T9SS type A sorting domain-containing protein [Saprospiraceae bacterium]|nr:T9SS type A sorting domain-containing protein [Saprospiraceae bacterium]MCB9326331.1 T9SS type A sorting domain-containing protein [Lewinellaceae bacterium]